MAKQKFKINIGAAAMRSGKESGLSPSFSSGNSDVPYQNLAGRPSEPAEL